MTLSTFLVILVASSLLIIDFRNLGLRSLASPAAGLFAYIIVYVVAFELYMKSDGIILIQSHFNAVFLDSASRATLVLVLGCSVGYLLAIVFSRKKRIAPRKLPYVIYEKRWPRILLVMAVSSAVYMYFSGQLRFTYNALDNPLERVDVGYILQALDLAIPAIVILYFIDLSRGRVSHETIVILFLVCGLYLVAGARYRLFCLLLGIGSVWLQCNPRKHKIFIMLGVLLLVIPAAGVIGIVRSYRAGLNFDLLGGATFLDMISRGFNEASATVALGAVVEMVPRFMNYVGLDPIWVAISQPIPRILWPDKPVPDYLSVVPMSLGAGAEFFGLALPFSGELYLMGGYAALFVGAILAFFGLEMLFVRALARGDVPLASAIFLFVPTLLSRGYLAQAVTSFAFLVIPVFLIGSKVGSRRARSLRALRSTHSYRRVM